MRSDDRTDGAGRGGRALVVKELHRRLRATAGAPPAADHGVVVAADEAQAARWRRAASRSRSALDEWIARALDHAAANAASGH